MKVIEKHFQNRLRDVPHKISIQIFKLRYEGITWQRIKKDFAKKRVPLRQIKLSLKHFTETPLEERGIIYMLCKAC